MFKYFFTVSANITARAITITADDKSKTQGEALPELTYTLSEALIDGNSVSGKLAVEKSDELGIHDIMRGTLDISSGNYAITYVKGILTVSATINAENFTQGLNENFNSTIPALEGTLLANGVQTSASMVNQNTMDYSELVLLEIKAIESRGTDYSVLPGGMEAADAPRTFTSVTSQMANVSVMSIDELMPELGDAVTRTDDVPNVNGFASGKEISIDAGIETDCEIEFVTPSVRAQRTLFDNHTVRLEELLPEGYDLVFYTDLLLEKSDAFKSDYEKLLDEIMAVI